MPILNAITFEPSEHIRRIRPQVPLAAIAAALLLSACAGTMNSIVSEPAHIAAAPQAAPASIQPAIRKLITARKADFAEQLQAFYAARDYQPAWTNEDRKALTAILSHADEHGLRPEEYLVPDPERLRTAEERANYDIAFSEAALRYGRDLQQGRVFPASVYDDVELPATHYDGAAELADAVAHHHLSAFFEAREPLHAGYRNLEKALSEYRDIAAEGGWPAIPGNGEVRLDGKDPRAALLVKRLSVEDPILARIANPSRAEIMDAVKRFQARHGLEEDGRVGGGTLAALNVPAAERAAQIAANMERWRWLPRVMEPRYVMVNAAEQSVQYVRDGKVVLTSRVIVGRKASPTPITRSEIQAVVVNPPWNVPGDIAARDLLPRLKQNANYLATKHMVLTDGPKDDPYGRKIDWRKVTAADFPYAIQQLPGPGTALGALMLDSPNDFDVYLHDTPDKKFFALTDREISNGCVRVQQIFPLASLALRDDPEKGLAELRKEQRTGETQRLTLEDPLAVYFQYWTAIADADGHVQFRPDHYGRDGVLIDALGGRLVKRPKPLPEIASSALPADMDPTP